MADSEHCPPGVEYFTHKAGTSKGKFTPAVGTGFESVSKVSGNSPVASKDFVAKAKTSTPSGVVRGDGTRNAAPGKHAQAKVSYSPPSTNAPFTPPAVAKHSGVAAPKKRK